MINKSTMTLKEELRTLREDIYTPSYASSDDVEHERRLINNKLQRENWLMLELIMRKLSINL